VAAGDVALDRRLVVTFRAPPASGRGFLERARALEARMSSEGGVLVAWDALRLSFVWSASELAKVVALTTTAGVDLEDGEVPWAVGVAEGTVEPLAADGSRGALAWGPPLLASTLLASAAAPGEIVFAETATAVRSGELLAAGTRVGREGDLKVRGIRLDPAQPWRRDAVEQIARMRVAPLVGAPPGAPLGPGSLLVVRADPGTGGTRYLGEIAASVPRALFVSPSGSTYEPLGALRRALARSITRELSPMMLELAEPLEALLDGHGVKLDVAARLVTAFLWPKSEGQGPGLLVVDDAKSVDPATLEACVRAAQGESASFGLAARLDATSGLPSVLASLTTNITELELAPLARADAEALAGGCTNDALDDDARRRFARLAGNVPLGIVEAVTYGIVTGEIAWRGERAAPRSRVSGRGKPRTAAEWIGLRAREESEPGQVLLAVIALLGGEAKVPRLGRVLARAGHRVDVDHLLEELVRGRWIVDTQEDWVALPSRTHRDALARLVDDAARKALHAAAADVLEEEEGAFGRVEAAWHAAQSEQGARAARILLAAAKGTADARLEASTTQLIAFARRADPSCEEPAMELLANALSRAPSLAPAASLVPSTTRMPSQHPLVIVGDEASGFEADGDDSEPPTLARMDLPPATEQGTPAPDALSSGAEIATRLASLAKEALLGADNAALERWVDGLRAAGESPLLTERLRALSRLGRGDVGDALRVLRRTRAALDPGDHRLRCQTSLALGVALSVAGRPQEALLEGMEALARARQIEDARGAEACLAFLAKLYTSQGRDEAGKLRPTA